ncbi:double-strand break repair helicase AddA [Magnetospirillum sulfuroxidans]|uniref:DNA 3'-5' helicase n=1 Tax=Magnetospirillum sulfuroxidans TaxID=611300 RepID=A0ABS5ID72_9PROT|nr:double-strand break repair helicase AddA [Magnetospirillum sulfuroxidans]MBR9972370.1 double-strand break repair helicase AddA [Magnetospirillum sulfuroxidans]
MTAIHELIAHATRKQHEAADPAASVWVAASAGTGKTKVLTDRVLNLLLAGNAPHKLLCLTFTKAAAAEMSNRINGKLAGWAIADDAPLAKALAELLGRPATEAETTRARRLFALVLDAPGGMHIETIHAFCQSLLRRFPLEAAIAPHFQVMDDRDAGELLEDAKEEVLIAARGDTDPTLAAALDDITRHIHETAFPELLAELASDRGRLKRLLDRHGGVEPTIADARGKLGLEAGETASTILAAACAEEACAAETLRQAVPILLAGGKSDQEKGNRLAAWLADPARRQAGFSDYCLSVLTAKGETRTKLVTNALRDAHPWLEPALNTEAERLIRVNARLKSAQIAQSTSALLRLGHALLIAYERRKQGRALMDYDDLILAARDLLGRPGFAPWVLYKLDGGIDHVLIDEAQDTNPDQWAVVAALTEEFFTGLGAREQMRTVFAVGDIKQSIYSFQRADPKAFDDMRQRFAVHVPAADKLWREIPLNLSFRSTRAVLDAVDAVFAGTGPGRDGVTSADPHPEHLAFRLGQAGLVEVWPAVKPRPADEIAAWKPPIERLRGDSPRTRLARLIARRIAAMIESETLDSQNRPVRAGDVLVLVRRRGGFVEDLVRALKELKVPVAGADRMVLTEQMAVMDLMALGNFLLLPEDDLTLATVLKGPLVGLSEDALFQLAWNRGKANLWETLKAKAGTDSAFGRAEDYLSRLLALADRLPPFALYAHVLGKLGGKRALLARLGAEAEDPLDEFIGLAMAFERGHPPSLQGFLRWLESGGTEIKRDLEQGGRDAVRIMTVHGSKGLQAPIVFLPDTLQMPTKGPRLLWTGTPEDEILLWPPRAELADETCETARDAAKLAREREYRRLLYVAMTRAEDRLYVCGWETLRAAPAECWYNLIRSGLAPQAAEVEDPFLAAAGETDDATVLRLSCRQDLAVEAETVAETPRILTELPLWAASAAPPEPAPPRPLAPSKPEGEEPPVRSPLAGSDGLARFRRGKLIHKLLQILPELPRDRRAQAAIRFLKGNGQLETATALALANEVSDILDHPNFAPLFAPGSRAEVPIVGLIGDRRALSGQVDRLVVTATEVLVVDYKTNRHPPAADDGIPDIYVRQMAAYRLALACIYPHHRIRCALVWTDGPSLREIDAGLLDDALAAMVG